MCNQLLIQAFLYYYGNVFFYVKLPGFALIRIQSLKKEVSKIWDFPRFANYLSVLDTRVEPMYEAKMPKIMMVAKTIAIFSALS